MSKSVFAEASFDRVVIVKTPSENFDPIRELEKRAAIGKRAGHDFSSSAEAYIIDAVLMRVQKLANEFLVSANGLFLSSHNDKSFKGVARKEVFSFYAGDGAQWLDLRRATKSHIQEELKKLSRDCEVDGVSAVLKYAKGGRNFVDNTDMPARVICEFSFKPNV